MIPQPALVKNQRGLRKADPVVVPAPVGGWNARDPLAQMPEKDAIVLDNWFPTAADVQIRPGTVRWATAFPSQPLSLFAWNGGAEQFLFAATDTGIHNATPNTDVVDPVATCNSGRFQYVNFSILGGHYLILVNGLDKLKTFDGVDWKEMDEATVPGITGAPTQELTNVAVIMRRLWFTRADSLSAWYLPVAQIGGALSEFPLGQVFKRGGYLVAVTNWTIDGGEGTDDRTVFISSEGEIAVYQGTDPDSAATFQKVGTYYVGEPLGRNCFCKFGGDVLILCQVGLFALSSVVQGRNVDKAQAMTSKIATAFSLAAAAYGNNPGWQAVVFPQGSLLLVNVPVSSAVTHQYVMNVLTGAWCRMTGVLAGAWEVFEKGLFFASRAEVGRAWTGHNDFGAAIICRAQTAYTDFRRPGYKKHIKLVQPSVVVEGDILLQAGIDVDYQVNKFSSTVFAGLTPGDNWDSALWDQAVWGAGVEAKQDWMTIQSYPCNAAAFRLQCGSTVATLRWSATKFLFEKVGVL